MQFSEQESIREHKHNRNQENSMKMFFFSLFKDCCVLGSSQTHVWENKSRLFPGHCSTLQLQRYGSFTGPSATWKDLLCEQQGCVSLTAHHGSKPNRSKSAGVL